MGLMLRSTGFPATRKANGGFLWPKTTEGRRASLPGEALLVWLVQSLGDKRGMKRGMGSFNASYSRTNQRNWPVVSDLSRLCSIVLDVLMQDNNYPAQIFGLQPPRNRHFR